MDPYEILGVLSDADDETIRKAYLDLVRRNSPDSEPEAFKRINVAYEALKDEKSRLNYYLFDRETPGDSPFQALLQDVSTSQKRTPLNYNELKEFLKQCAKK